MKLYLRNKIKKEDFVRNHVRRAASLYLLFFSSMNSQKSFLGQPGLHHAEQRTSLLAGASSYLSPDKDAQDMPQAKLSSGNTWHMSGNSPFPVSFPHFEIKLQPLHLVTS